MSTFCWLVPGPATPDHVRANRWLNSVTEFSTAPVTQMGFLRVSMSAAYGASFCRRPNRSPSHSQAQIASFRDRRRVGGFAPCALQRKGCDGWSLRPVGPPATASSSGTWTEPSARRRGPPALRKTRFDATMPDESNTTCSSATARRTRMRCGRWRSDCGQTG